MKKKVLISIFVVAIAAVAGWNVSQGMSDSTLSDMVLANVEALADDESMTTEQFANIGCECADSGSCAANNGNTYSYAKRK
jgi:hypothetical protein